jgi:predicted ArsR family transcriptional regulator
LNENPGMTADKLATFLKINVALVKEHILEAEEQGYICVDESHEGLRYYSN